MPNKGAFAIKIVRGALKWSLKGGSRLIEVAATAGLTVCYFCSDFHEIFTKFRTKKLGMIYTFSGSLVHFLIVKGPLLGPKSSLGKSLMLWVHKRTVSMRPLF